jgi:probable rRNA maturation factor
MADGRHTPRILVDDRQTAPVDVQGLARLAEVALLGEGAEQTELSVSFVTDDEIADLHRRYMDEEGPTDVLSFPLGEVDEEGVRILGDVVISPSAAERNNPSDRSSELRLLLVHGILHLLGHDHQDDMSRASMWALQERYTGVKVP